MEAPVLESIFNETAGVGVWNVIKKRLQHRCFTVNYAKFLRTPILDQLLLKNQNQNSEDISFYQVNYFDKLYLRKSFFLPSELF